MDDNENNEDEVFVEAELESWCNNEVDDNKSIAIGVGGGGAGNKCGDGFGVVIFQCIFKKIRITSSSSPYVSFFYYSIFFFYPNLFCYWEYIVVHLRICHIN